MKAVNEEFLARIEPEFISWGLSRHPNPSSCFGRNDHGYHYDFADVRDQSDIKLASFAIIQPHASLWIKGYKAWRLNGAVQDLNVLFDTIQGIYTLNRKWSIRRPLLFRFELDPNDNDHPRSQARKLIDDVFLNLYKLREHLYG
jgi:hypothetical protein